MLTEYYLLTKALHLIAVISWMAGMLYLPRLFVYHTQVPAGSDQDRLFQVMERRLLRFIMLPAMIATFLLGIVLILQTGAGGPGTGGWMHAKLLLVLLLGGLHGMMAKYRRDFERGQNQKSARFFKIFNEIPTAAMVAIVLLVVLKPF